MCVIVPGTRRAAAPSATTILLASYTASRCIIVFPFTATPGPSGSNTIEARVGPCGPLITIATITTIIAAAARADATVSLCRLPDRERMPSAASPLRISLHECRILSHTSLPGSIDPWRGAIIFTIRSYRARHEAHSWICFFTRSTTRWPAVSAIYEERFLFVTCIFTVHQPYSFI